jgi:hypothetical protein
MDETLKDMRLAMERRIKLKTRVWSLFEGREQENGHAHGILSKNLID